MTGNTISLVNHQGRKYLTSDEYEFAHALTSNRDALVARLLQVHSNL